MDEFKKPYEYFEDKRGLILLFIFTLITIDVYQVFIYIVPTYGDLKHIPVLSICFLAISILYLLFLLFTIISCYQLKKNMPNISKIYLIVRTIFLSSCIIILFLYEVDIKNMLAFGKRYNSVIKLYITGLISPIAFVLLFSVGWYLYFLKSKRFK